MCCTAEGPTVGPRQRRRARRGPRAVATLLLIVGIAVALVAAASPPDPSGPSSRLDDATPAASQSVKVPYPGFSGNPLVVVKGILEGEATTPTPTGGGTPTPTPTAGETVEAATATPGSTQTAPPTSMALVLLAGDVSNPVFVLLFALVLGAAGALATRRRSADKRHVG